MDPSAGLTSYLFTQGVLGFAVFVLGWVAIKLYNSRENDRAGNITKVEYDKTWKVGGTTPVIDESGIVIDYKEDYEEESLSSSDIKTIKTWIKNNVAES